MKEERQVKAKCPKCKSRNLSLIEIWTGHTIQWNVENGLIDRREGSLEPGDPKKVEGHCYDCNHMWTFRGASQIDDILI